MKINQKPFWKNYFSEIFGLKKILNEIASQRKLHIGSTDREIPDIILKKDGKDLFIVELKQYSLLKKDDFEKQLLMEHFTKTYNKDIVESALKDFSFNCSERKKENTEIIENTIQYTEKSSYNKNEIPPKIVLLIGNRIVEAKEFKDKLLQAKSAKRFWYYKNGRIEEDVWNAYSFKSDSALLGNIRTTKYRNWKTSGLIKLVCKI